MKKFNQVLSFDLNEIIDCLGMGDFNNLAENLAGQDIGGVLSNISYAVVGVFDGMIQIQVIADIYPIE
jgi:hypothetical protein